MDDNNKTDARTAATKTFSSLGIALLVTATTMTLVQILFAVFGRVLVEHGSTFVSSTWFLWLRTFAPLYLFGMPPGLLLMKKLPVLEYEKIRISCKDFMIFLLMCFPLMYGGSLLGNLLSMLFSGGNATNALYTYAFDESPLKVIVLVVLAPIFEEFLFRKQLIDRCSQFGEKTAILYSALMFGLFHMNLYQFFYAFGLGLVFGYVYTRTRRLCYSAIMHMVVNFIGSVLTPMLLSSIDVNDIERMAAGQIGKEAMSEFLSSMAGFMIYTVLLLGLSIWGLVLLSVKASKLVYLSAAKELPKQGRFKTIYCNAGTILFMLFCVAICVRNLWM